VREVEQVDEGELLKKEYPVSVNSKDNQRTHITGQVLLLAQDDIIAFDLECFLLYCLVVCSVRVSKARVLGNRTGEPNGDCRLTGSKRAPEPRGTRMGQIGLLPHIQRFRTQSRPALFHSLVIDEALVLFGLTLRLAGSGKRGVPCPVYFCAT
jgi:hypothetical protein